MIRLFLLICGISLLPASSLYATEWRASLAEMPQSAMQDSDGNMIGAYVDLIKAIDKLAGTSTEIDIRPFGRSLRSLEIGQADYHIPLIEIPNKPSDDLSFAYSSETLFQVAFVFYTNKNKPLDMDKLGDYNLATDNAHIEFFPFKIDGLSCLSCGVKMVNVGHLDGFIFAQNEIDPFVEKLQLSNIHRQLYKNFNVKIIIPKGPAGEKVDAYFTKYIGQLRANNKYNSLLAPILAPYRDWQP